MFAYCNNNPSNLTDSTGCIPIGPLGIGDFYLIHKKVQEDCKEKKGWKTEVQVSGVDGKGRLDLYDKASNSYYEVKHRSAAYTLVRQKVRKSTDNQMKKYDAADIVDKRFPELNGVSPTRGMTFVSGEVEYGIWDVSYQWERPGLIVYDVKLNPERAATAAITGFAIIGMAVYSGGLSLPYTAPAFALLGG